MGTATIYSPSHDSLTLKSAEFTALDTLPRSVQTEEGFILFWKAKTQTCVPQRVQPVSRRVLDILEHLLEQDPLPPERIQATLDYVTFELQDEGQPTPLTSPAEELHKILQQELDQHLSLDILAEKAGMSRSRFIRQCRKHLGSSPAKYLADLRIAHAKEQLQHPVHTIAQVGYQVGYDSPSSFSHFFKNATGQSPKEYRTNCEWLV